MENVVIASCARTAIGRFGGALKNTTDAEIGPVAIKAAIEQAGLEGGQIDEVIFASGYRTGELPINSARVLR